MYMGGVLPEHRLLAEIEKFTFSINSNFCCSFGFVAVLAQSGTPVCCKQCPRPGFVGLEFFSPNHVQIKNQLHQHEGHIMFAISTPFAIEKSMQPFRIYFLRRACGTWTIPAS